jgi:hypothetical protein
MIIATSCDAESPTTNPESEMPPSLVAPLRPVAFNTEAPPRDGRIIDKAIFLSVCGIAS